MEVPIEPVGKAQEDTENGIPHSLEGFVERSVLGGLQFWASRSLISILGGVLLNPPCCAFYHFLCLFLTFLGLLYGDSDETRSLFCALPHGHSVCEGTRRVSFLTGKHAKNAFCGAFVKGQTRQTVAFMSLFLFEPRRPKTHELGNCRVEDPAQCRLCRVAG